LECNASLAQQVERTAFNRVVVGSIPTGGEQTPIERSFFCLLDFHSTQEPPRASFTVIV
jgi:hypothetical protein